MALHPEEIRSHEFPAVKRGGLDADAVRSFLGVLADDVDRLRSSLEESRVEARQAKDDASRAATEAAAAREAADAARAALAAAPGAPAAAQSFSAVGSHVDEVLAAAQHSAEGIVRDAESWSTAHRAEAEAYAAAVRAEVDDLRTTTEQQAATYRDETAAYAAALREDAEAHAATTRADAEADARAQYERLTAEASTRLEVVKHAERTLLERLTTTADELVRARDQFQSTVEAHADVVIEPTAFVAPEPEFAPTDTHDDAVAWPDTGAEWSDDAAAEPPAANDAWPDTEPAEVTPAPADHTDPAGDDLVDDTGRDVATPIEPAPISDAEAWAAPSPEVTDPATAHDVTDPATMWAVAPDTDQADDSLAAGDASWSVDPEATAGGVEPTQADADEPTAWIGAESPAAPEPAASTTWSSAPDSGDLAAGTSAAWGADAPAEPAIEDIEVPAEWTTEAVDVPAEPAPWGASGDQGSAGHAWAATSSEVEADVPDAWAVDAEAASPWLAPADETTPTGDAWTTAEAAAWTTDDGVDRAWTDTDSAWAVPDPGTSALDEVPAAWTSADPGVDVSEAPWAPPAAETNWSGGEAAPAWMADASGDASPAWATAEATGREAAGAAWAPPAPTADDSAGDDDPLAAMVRRAVERATDGDGVN